MKIEAENMKERVATEELVRELVRDDARRGDFNYQDGVASECGHERMDIRFLSGKQSVLDAVGNDRIALLENFAVEHSIKDCPA